MLLVNPASASFAQNADNSTLLNRINELENQVQTLSRAVYHGGPMPAPAPVETAVPAAALSGYEDRISQLEQQNRQLTGKVEQLTFDIQQLQQKLGQTGAPPVPVNNTMNNGFGSPQPLAPPRPQSYTPTPSPYVGAPYAQTAANNGSLSGGEMNGSGDGQRTLLGNMSSTGGADAADTLYEDAFADIRDGKYDSAATKFQKFMASYPRHALASNAQYWLAETYYVRADYRTSAKLFAQGYQDYPQGTKAPASLLKLGMSLAKLGKKDDACLSFQQLKKEFPGGQTPEIQAADKEMSATGCKG